MQRLTGLDGAFLALESPTTHLHILGAMVFDPADAPGGLSFRKIRRRVAERVPLVPPLRMRMVEVPFGLRHAALVEDPHFDLDFHVRRRGLPGPGGREEFTELVADIASRPLDRHRPLWEFHVVEGLEHGYVGLVSKVHHAIIDGVSGAEVLAAFLDASPDPTPWPLFGVDRDRRETRAPVDRSGAKAQTPGAESAGPQWAPPALPGDLAQVRQALGALPGQVEAAARSIARTVRTARTLASRNRELPGPPPPAPFEAPRTSINRSISPHRRVAVADLPLADIRRIGEVLGGTTNDVVLAVAAGALRTFFSGREEEPERSLVALVPVSVRAEEEAGALGNRVSGMLVSLATSVSDPIARLGRIREGMASAKDQNRDVDPGVFSSWAETTLPAVATRASRLVTNLRLFDRLAPLCNLIVSNVPGPDVPLYLAGARLVSLHPLGPIVEGVGVNVTVFSYCETVHVGLQGCWDLVPDIDVLARAMEESLAELLDVARRKARPVPWWHDELPA